MNNMRGGTARHMYAPGHEPAEGGWTQVVPLIEALLPPLILAVLVLGVFRGAFLLAHRWQARRIAATRRAGAARLLAELEAEASQQAEERRRRGYLAVDTRFERRVP